MSLAFLENLINRYMYLQDGIFVSVVVVMTTISHLGESQFDPMFS